jgi:hypothetical protein
MLDGAVWTQGDEEQLDATPHRLSRLRRPAQFYSRIQTCQPCFSLSAMFLPACRKMPPNPPRPCTLGSATSIHIPYLVVYRVLYISCPSPVLRHPIFQSIFADPHRMGSKPAQPSGRVERDEGLVARSRSKADQTWSELAAAHPCKQTVAHGNANNIAPLMSGLQPQLLHLFFSSSPRPQLSFGQSGRVVSL